MKKIQRFIIVDDDPYCNMLCKYIVRQVAGAIELLEFTRPEEGIEYIESAYTTADDCPTVLFLDINMPVMSGWDFLERYDKAESNIKNQFTICILSSSVDHRDKERAAAKKYVKEFLLKPLTKEMVEKVLKGFLMPQERGL